uniref:Uncharacterized protein n=1 Tax=Romanomermis culicivorax TaxID=13658 RepID=A0A915IHB7_ROMCU
MSLHFSCESSVDVDRRCGEDSLFFRTECCVGAKGGGDGADVRCCTVPTSGFWTMMAFLVLFIIGIFVLIVKFLIKKLRQTYAPFNQNLSLLRQVVLNEDLL